MIPSRLSAGALAAAALAALGASPARAQAAPDLVPPAQREKVLNNAERVLEARAQPVDLPTPLPNPFVAKESSAPEPDVAESAARQPATFGIELLARLAAQIPATGTVTMGGEPMLLLGQKRLKVGDTYTISFEGQTYEVSIAAVSSTSFTVKRGELLFSRPTRLSGSTDIPPSNRP